MNFVSWILEIKYGCLARASLKGLHSIMGTTKGNSRTRGKGQRILLEYKIIKRERVTERVNAITGHSEVPEFIQGVLGKEERRWWGNMPKEIMEKISQMEDKQETLAWKALPECHCEFISVRRLTSHTVKKKTTGPR